MTFVAKRMIITTPMENLPMITSSRPNVSQSGLLPQL